MSQTQSRDPFFVFGAPRSGTTVLRDVLRLHPDLECPEETFFYRWDDAFKSDRFEQQYRNNPTIRSHREIDGIEEGQFWDIYEEASTRRELQIFYMEAFLKAQGKPTARWFDKTPQNTNNLLRIAEDFPESRLVHIHRNPLDVISSLMQGRKFEPHTFDAAMNVWLEAVQAGVFLNRHLPDRVFSIDLMELVKRPGSTTSRLSIFLGLHPPLDGAETVLKKPPHRYHALHDDEIFRMIDVCGSYLGPLGYPTDIAGYRQVLTETSESEKRPG